MGNRLCFKFLVFLLVLGIQSCKTHPKKEEKSFEGAIQNSVSFESKDDAFSKYIENFTELMLPFDFNNLWKEIGAKINKKADKQILFFDNKVVKDLVIDRISQAYCAYRIPISENCIGLVYTIQDNVNHQVILVTYNETGKAVSGINIHGEFNDSEYKLNGIVKKDLTIEVHDSIFVFENNKLTPQYREFREYKIEQNGNIVNLNSKKLNKTIFEDNELKALIGIWHEDPVMSSAIGSTLTFYPNNTYRQRVGEGGKERYVYTKGTWKISNEILELTPIKDGVLEGGEIIFNQVVEDSVLKGAKIIEIDSKREASILDISKVDFNEDFNKQTVTIGKQTYYKLDENPNEDYWSE
jgi:hypothetical protein